MTILVETPRTMPTDTTQLDDVKARIKRVIQKATNLPLDRIGDTTSFRGELDLDSLSLLEIGVDVDYEFALGLPDERYRALDSVAETAALVVAELATREAPAAASRA